VLDKTDSIYVMDDGIIIEQGTYEDLMANSVVFARLMEEHGNLESASSVSQDNVEQLRMTATRGGEDGP